MYTTTGVDAIATITELRSRTSELLDHVRNTKASILIQKNNEAYAVLIDWETYQDLLEPRSDRNPAHDRSPQHGNRAAGTPEENVRQSAQRSRK
jgi:prevent-host-death family protein